MMMPSRAPEARFTTASFGTDWAAYCINWLTEYERTLDPQWLNKIKVGMDTQLALARVPGQLLGAGAYDPKTAKFMGQAGRFEMPPAAPVAAAEPKAGPAAKGPDTKKGRGGATKGGRGGADVGGATGFDLLFGTIEIMAEMERVVDHPKYWEAWHYYAANTPGSPMAYAAYITKNADLGRKAAETLIAAAQPREIRSRVRDVLDHFLGIRGVEGPQAREIGLVIDGVQHADARLGRVVDHLAHGFDRPPVHIDDGEPRTGGQAIELVEQPTADDEHLRRRSLRAHLREKRREAVLEREVVEAPGKSPGPPVIS